MSSKLRIGIAAAGRFHVLDLARELCALGHEVSFYSYVPRFRARKFGLPDECHVSLLPFSGVVLAWERFAPRLAPQLRERALYTMLNQAVIARMRPCEVFICMSGIYLEAAREAQRRFRAQIWLERGSQHILAQDRILASAGQARRPSRLTIQRELDGYALADRIVVPSTHVEESFQGDPSARQKIFRNPYGVDLEMFPLFSERKPHRPAVALFVGTWSMQKGSDLLAAAVKQVPGVRLIHVGKLGDCSFPAEDRRFSHIDSVPQWELAKFYADADVFVLPSRQDGLGVVLAQALATGLPVICTDHTGGIDLAHTAALRERIHVIPADDALALAQALETARVRASQDERWPALEPIDRQTLSWAAYAKRYADELLRTVH